MSGLQAVFCSVPVTPVIRQTWIVIAVHFSCGLCWARYLVFLEFIICWWSLVFWNQCLGRMCSISKSIENNACSRSTQCTWLGPGNSQLLANSKMTWPGQGYLMSKICTQTPRQQIYFTSQPSTELDPSLLSGLLYVKTSLKQTSQTLQLQLVRQYEDVVLD